MKLDIRTLAFIGSLIFVTQVIVLFVQYRVNKTYRGLRWWVMGSALMALGVIFMPLVTVKSLVILARFANPLVVLGQIFLYIGIVKFLNKKENRLILFSIYSIFLIFYISYMYIKNDISARTVIVSATLATISIMTAYKLFFKKDKLISVSTNFTAVIFFIYGCFLAVRTFFALTLPHIHSYSEQGISLVLAFIISIIISTLWTFGFIIMLNQLLNIENIIEKEKIQQLVQQLEIERNTAQLNSITDSLTGLANRRYFDEALTTEFYRLQRSGSILSLIMLDIDYFKNFNDTYGHLAGDDCLRQIGNLFKTIIKRIPDIVARYGGEEFVVILPETDDKGAKALAQRIRKAVEELAIPHSGSNISEYVTVSIGVVTVNIEGLNSPEQVVTLADNALYCAKEGGRNRVEINNKYRKNKNKLII